MFHVVGLNKAQPGQRLSKSSLTRPLRGESRANITHHYSFWNTAFNMTYNQDCRLVRFAITPADSISTHSESPLDYGLPAVPCDWYTEDITLVTRIHLAPGPLRATSCTWAFVTLCEARLPSRSTSFTEFPLAAAVGCVKNVLIPLPQRLESVICPWLLVNRIVHQSWDHNTLLSECQPLLHPPDKWTDLTRSNARNDRIDSEEV